MSNDCSPLEGWEIWTGLLLRLRGEVLAHVSGVHRLRSDLLDLLGLALVLQVMCLPLHLSRWSDVLINLNLRFVILYELKFFGLSKFSGTAGQGSLMGGSSNQSHLLKVQIFQLGLEVVQRLLPQRSGRYSNVLADV